MTFVPLQIPPGICKTRSGEGAAGRWVDCKNVQFVDGRPEKRPGFARHNDTDLLGRARGMNSWTNVSGGTPIYAVGTHRKLYGAPDGGDITDITPLRFQLELTDALSTTEDLGGVSIDWPAHGRSVDDVVTFYGNSFQGGSQVAGILLNGERVVVAVPDANTVVVYPADDAGTLGADPFTTANTSAVVTVAHGGHGRESGDTVWFNGATAVNGITISGDYQITVVDANSYTITHSAPASGDGAGGGVAVDYFYGLPANDTVVDGGGTVAVIVPLTDPFETTDGSAVVVVTHPNHGARAQAFVHISGASAVGGITIDGEYEIASVIGANSYRIVHSSPALADDVGGGDVHIEYEIDPGNADKVTAALRGFGTGPLGSGFFGASGPANDATYFDPRIWSVDAFGEDGVMSPLGGAVYYWDSSAGGRAERIPNAPTGLRGIFMTEEGHLHALGIGGDALKFGWCDQRNLNVWTPSDTNTANNSRRVRHGSTLVAGTPVGNGMNLIWTDTAIYTHQYTGSKFIYDTRLGAKNAGLIAPQAFAVTPVGVMWMSPNNFYLWNGSVQQIPNAHDVEEWVFHNMDVNQRSKCFAYYCPICGYVYFYFVPTGGAEPSLYVAVDIHDLVWVNGEETRTTGTAFRSGRQAPYLVSGPAIYEHEVGLDADGAAAESRIELAPYSLKDWSEILGLDPDFKRQTGAVEISITTYDRDAQTVVDTESGTIAPGDELVDLRSSGRNISLAFSQQVLGGDWALDTPQIDVRTAGRRR